MKRFRPLVALACLVASDALLKSYVLSSPALAEHAGLFALGVGTVLAGCAIYFFWLLRDPATGDWREPADPESFVSRFEWSIALTLVALGAVLRFWHLRDPRMGLFADEAYNGLDALGIRDFGQRPVFLEANLGREALVAYLDALSIGIFGNTAFAIRVVTALAGSLTLLAFYGLARKLVSTENALLALFLFAVSKAAIILCRLGLRFNLMHLFETTTLCFLVWGLTSTRRRYLPFVLAGIAAGIGAHTYIAYRLFPAVVVAFLLDRRFRSELRPNAKPLAVAAFLAVLVASPLLGYFARHPAAFSARMERTVAWGGEHEALPVVLEESTWRTLGMFTVSSDRNPRQNVNLEPLLSPFATAGFLLGFTFLLARLTRPTSAALLAYFVVAIAPGIFSAEAPHSSRAIGVLPVTMLLTARGLLLGYRLVRRSHAQIAKGLAVVVLAGTAVTGVVDALVRYRTIIEHQGPAATAIWGSDITEAKIARFLNSMKDPADVYLSPQLFFHPTVEYLTWGRSTHKLWMPGTEVSRTRPSLVVVVLARRNFWWLRNDAKKKLFEFWNYAYDLDDRTIALDLRHAYGGEKDVFKENDQPLMNDLRRAHPEGVERDADGFTTFEISPSP